MVPEIFLVIEQGEPYLQGKNLQFKNGEIVLGRTWEHYCPHVAFTNLCISRKHALIFLSNGVFQIMDLDSKHGTRVNGQELEPRQAHTLHHGDKITLAQGIVSIIFNNPAEADAGETIDFMAAFPFGASSQNSGLNINPERREVVSDGQSVNLSGKDLELLLLLYRSRNKAVSYDEIKVVVWPERSLDSVTGVPDVGNDEITALVYRLRKRLGNSGALIKAVPRYGYLLEFE